MESLHEAIDSVTEKLTEMEYILDSRANALRVLGLTQLSDELYEMSETLREVTILLLHAESAESNERLDIARTNSLTVLQGVLAGMKVSKD